ncbi:hypothetical protein LP422_20925 [Janibacter limosus]|nr:hypothetical protein LP422_20925 [Janibacter limosus]
MRTAEPIPTMLLATGEDFAEYTRRVDNDAAGFWSVAYFGLHAIQPELWDFAKRVSAELSHSIGYRPAGRVDIDCFVGRYEFTHTGPHVDQAHNFGFTVEAGKTMLARPSKFSHLTGTGKAEYDSVREGAVALENTSDVVCYFPHDWVHVAETPTRPSVNLNVTFWNFDDLSGHAVSEHIDSLFGPPATTQMNPPVNGPMSLSSADMDLAKALAAGSGQPLRDRLTEIELVRSTSGNLNVPRPVLAGVNTQQQGGVVRLREGASLGWSVSSDGETLSIGGNGHLGRLPVRPALLSALESLVSGAAVSPAGDEDLSVLVASLHSWGVVA